MRGCSYYFKIQKFSIDIFEKIAYNTIKESTGLCTEQLKETRSYTIIIFVIVTCVIQCP